jgi:predicted metal-dependent peptidase
MNKDELIKDVRRVFSTLSVIAPFSYPLLMMPIIIREDIKSWAGTNGVTFFVNPKEWNKLEFREKLFVAMHEWIHIVMQHAKRMQGRRHRIWNVACDYAVNDLIMNEMEDHFQPPTGILLDRDLFYDKTAEEIYNLLIEMIDDKKEDGKDPVCNHCGQKFQSGDRMAGDGENGCGSCGRPADFNVPAPPFIGAEDGVNQLMADDYGAPWGNDLSQMPSNIDNQEMIDAIIKAAARARGMKRGFMPGKYEDYVTQLKKSNIPWERLLFRYAKESLKGSTDRNPFRPDPKYLPFDVFIPREQGRRIGKLVFIVDTSASMETKEFEIVCGHLERLGSLVDKCTVITADTKVQSVFKVKKIKREMAQGKIKFKGRGGTNMTEAFKLAEKLDPQLIVLYSDMHIGDFPQRPKKAKTIFLATKDSEMESSPYGVFIKMDKR